jgi:hypothetical protein
VEVRCLGIHIPKFEDTVRTAEISINNWRAARDKLIAGLWKGPHKKARG